MDPLCSVEEGQLKGQRETDIQGTPFLGFMGIPYAKAPLGNLRFKAPQPPQKWEGIRDATKQGSSCSCIQVMPTEKGILMQRSGSEDCLFLNVYTRKIYQKNDELKSVMVYVHGGGFVTGSSDRAQYGPEFLMTEDIVFVTINYRLGVLGFLAIDDLSLEVTGNAGLKDQVEALKWVKRNIKQFCGDPNNVTIFGESAGGASVHFLVLSPLAKGLFHKAIMQSGTSLCPWSRGVNDYKQLSKKLGCAESKDENILSFLQNVPVDDILDAQKELGDWLNPGAKRHFCPSIEAKTENSLISETPMELMTSGCYNHVPLILGYNSLEGLLEGWVDQVGFTSNFKDFVPFYFGYPRGSEKFKELNKTISQFYFGAESPDLEQKENLFKVLTDIMFLRAIYLTATVHAKTSQEPVYYYRMSLETELNNFKKIGQIDVKGVSHGDDLGYLFKSENSDLKKGSIEEISVLRFVKMWTNFAKTGKPIGVKDSLLNADWRPITEKELNFLDIGTDLVPGTDPDIERMEFWENLEKELKKFY